MKMRLDRWDFFEIGSIQSGDKMRDENREEKHEEHVMYSLTVYFVSSGTNTFSVTNHFSNMYVMRLQF